MAHLQRSRATLRISGDLLVPSEISALLGVEPTFAQAKGETIIGRATGNSRVAKSGLWRLEASESEPENIDGQVEELFAKINTDPIVWSRLREQFQVDLFCGLFMGSGDEGFSISPATQFLLGQRGIELSLCLYAPDKE